MYMLPFTCSDNANCAVGNVSSLAILPNFLSSSCDYDVIGCAIVT